MGDIANMMLEGILCQDCGMYLDDNENRLGYPQSCEDCKEDEKRKQKLNLHPKIKCLVCNKPCRGEQGLEAHKKAKHI